MQKFEYKVKKIDAKGWKSEIGVAEMESALNTLGGEGWDLATAFDGSKLQGSTTEVYLIFKRPDGAISEN